MKILKLHQTVKLICCGNIRTEVRTCRDSKLFLGVQDTVKYTVEILQLRITIHLRLQPHVSIIHVVISMDSDAKLSPDEPFRAVLAKQN